MRIVLSGASGFVGQALVERLRGAGHELRVLGRRPVAGCASYQWDLLGGEPPAEALEGAEAVIHLAGEPVAQRWTTEAKRRIRDTRVLGTRSMVRALTTQSPRPATLLSASAIGYYGDRADEAMDERSEPGADFLGRTCVAWEREAELAESLGIRVVRLRIGVVLGLGGGALKKMLPPFKAGVGGPLGGGRQWMSWIHLDDLVGLIDFALETPALSGAVNAVAPNPVTNAQFSSALGAALHRPALIPTPGFAVKLLFGEMAEIVLGSQRVLPRAAQAAGYQFKLTEATKALKNLLER
jgi:uncharacterized protein (TIGR01777 family)